MWVSTITATEITLVSKTVKPGRAAGCDEIRPEMFTP